MAQQDLVHTVQPGDNLHDLAKRYLADPSEWPQLQRLNKVLHPRRLVPGSQLVIPAALARPTPAPAQVLHVAGSASVTNGSQATAPLSAGETVHEGTRIEVGDNGFVTLKLADGSVVRLAAGSAANLQELRHGSASGRSQSVIQLERGRVDATVTPMPSASRSRFEVHTPRAIGGVRGTTFGVAVDTQGDFIGDVREGSIRVQARRAASGPSGAAALVNAGEGTRVGAADAPIAVVPLLAAPDLSAVPSVLEDIAWIEVPLAKDAAVSGWQVRIASDAAGERVLRNGRFTQPLARFAGLEDGDYQLAVRALDSRGIPGGEAIRSITVNARPQAPLLREPRAGSRLPPTSVELLCTEGSDVVGYRFQVARDAAFQDLVAQTPDQKQCRYGVPELAPGTYHWRVASVATDAQAQRDQGPFSAPMTFKVVPLPPQPAAPSLDSENGKQLSVAWSVSPGGPWRHQIQIGHDSGFTRLLDDQQLDQPAFQRPLPAPGTYHVRVRQIDPEGLQGAWSSPQRLEVLGQILTTGQQPLTTLDGQPVRPGTQ